MNKFNLEEKYFTHCINDLGYQIKNLNSLEKKLYIMHEKRNFNINTISLLTDLSLDEVKRKLLVIERKMNSNSSSDNDSSDNDLSDNYYMDNKSENTKYKDIIEIILKKHNGIDMSNNRKTLVIVKTLLKYNGVNVEYSDISKAIQLYISNKNF